MTINAPAAVLLLLYELAAERQGVAADALGGTIQNDILERICCPRHLHLPPRPSMRFVTDTFAYCAERIPKWNTISISGYHMREAGCTAVQEIAFTLANGIAYVSAAQAAGLDVDRFAAPACRFSLPATTTSSKKSPNSARRASLWATIMRERFGAKKEQSLNATLPHRRPPAQA
jgi:methylmalonyl-CoA mutase N-terminal domain/subunit